MNILIADDHAIVRKGLIQLMKEEYPFAAVTEVVNSTEVLASVRGKKWDILLLDISMPGRNGVEVLKQLRAEGVKTPILMLSIHPEDQYAVRVLKAGASGFLNKASATEELAAAMRIVLTGRKYVTPWLAEKLADNTADDSYKPLHALLSDRELQVFQMIAGGKAVSEIAEELYLSVNTISTYRTRILEKLALSNNAEMTRYALDNELI